MEMCDKCSGSGYGGHPDSGYLCSKCRGAGGVAEQPMLTAEGLFRAMEATEWHRSQIQGFRYGDRLVIRDCTIPGELSEVWEIQADQADAHEEMMDEIQIRQYQIALNYLSPSFTKI